MDDVLPRVLHVDDNEFFATVTAGVLEDDHGLTVATEHDAAAALDRLESEWFDCIVSDYEMPEMDGLDLLDAVREEHPKLPFILLTGGGSEETASEAIAAGVTDYLPKETGKEQFTVLANRIENAIDRRRTERLANRLVGVNDLVWNASQAVLEASSRETIEETVCKQFAASEPYQFAWVGKTATDDGIRPEVGANGDPGAASTVSLSETVVDDHPAVAQAIRTGEVRTTDSPALSTYLDSALDMNSPRAEAAVVPFTHQTECYGALAVWSSARTAFGDTECRVLSKFGTNVAYAIDSVQTRKELVRREQRLQVFNRVLRHNLRNDLNVVLGHADAIREEYPGAADTAAVIERKAEGLIEISEKAREVGKTLDGQDATRQELDLAECVERTCAEFRETYPDADVTVDFPEPVAVYADRTLDAALSEVVENAIEHNDDRPSVTISVTVPEDDPEWVELAVTDDGPGIPDEEREVLVEGEETALHHGSGLGLWLTNWIVGKFGGELRFEDETNEGGTVVLKLQRADVPSRHRHAR